MPTLSIPLATWVTGRLATFEATRALGLSDQRLAQLMGVSQPAVANWAKGTTRIPEVRWLALNFLVWRLIEWFGRAARSMPPADDFEDPKHARRFEVARRAAGLWAELSRQEIQETIGEPGPELTKRAEELMWQMMHELAARGMVEAPAD
jgi:hypothetical protein